MDEKKVKKNQSQILDSVLQEVSGGKVDYIGRDSSMFSGRPMDTTCPKCGTIYKMASGLAGEYYDGRNCPKCGSDSKKR